jgi:hypothetical protein
MLEDKKFREDRRLRLRKGSSIKIGGGDKTLRKTFNIDEVIHDPDEYFQRMKKRRDPGAKSANRKKSASKSVIEENKEYENDSWDSDFD